MVFDDTGGKCKEGIEMIGGRDIPKDSEGGPITGVKDGIAGIGVGQIGVELITAGGGGPRFRGGKVEPKEGGMGAELTEHIEVEPRVGPMGATGLGKGARRG